MNGLKGATVAFIVMSASYLFLKSKKRNVHEDG